MGCSQSTAVAPLPDRKISAAGSEAKAQTNAAEVPSPNKLGVQQQEKKADHADAGDLMDRGFGSVMTTPAPSSANTACPSSSTSLRPLSGSQAPGSAGQAPGSAGKTPGDAAQEAGSPGKAPGSAGKAPGSAGTDDAATVAALAAAEPALEGQEDAAAVLEAGPGLAPEGSEALRGEDWGQSKAGKEAAAATAAAVAAGEAVIATAAEDERGSRISAATRADAALLSSFPEVASQGISLRGLRRLWARIQALFESGTFSEAMEVEEADGSKWRLEGADYLDALTPAHLVHMWILKEAGQGRLSDVKELVDPADVGRPTFFISHTWGGSVRLLMDSASAYLSSSGQHVRVWLDWVAVRQAAGAGREEDLAAVGQVLGVCSGGTLVVADVHSLNPTSRAWCLYEWSQTLALHGPDALHLRTLPVDGLDELCGSLDPGCMSLVQCRLKADRDRLRSWVLQCSGTEQKCCTELKLQMLLRPLRLAPDLELLAGRSSGEPWAQSLAPVQQWMGQQAGTRWTSRALCVMGGEGTGKSCIAAAVCTHLLGWQWQAPETSRHTPGLWQWQAPGGKWPASAALFLKQLDQRSLDPVRMIKSIAYQLSLSVPALRDHLLTLKPSQVDVLTSMEAAFALLLGPLVLIHDNIIILMDGLDEAEPELLPGQLLPGKPRGVRARGNPAVSLLLSCLVTKLPANVRFILTSRPDAAAGGLRDALRRTALPNITFLEPWQLTAAGQQAEQGAAAAAAAAGKEAGAAAPAVPAHVGRALLFDALVKDCGLQLPTPGSPDVNSVSWAYASVFGPHSKLSASTTSLLQVLAAAQEPLPHTLLQSMGLADALVSLPGWGQLIWLSGGHVHMLHRSLRAWIIGAPSMPAFARAAGSAGSTAAAEVPSAACGVDVAGGHALLGRHLLRHVLKAGGECGAAVRRAPVDEEDEFGFAEEGEPAMVALVPDYVAKYSVLHLCYASPAACGPLLDSALAQWEFLRQVFQAGHGPKLLAALGEVEEHSKYSLDAFRWMRLCFTEFTASSEDMESITLRCCPFSHSIKYREAAHRLKAWFTAASLGGNHGGDWPADLAVFKGHTGPVLSVSFSPDGRQVATGGDDNTARVWDLATTQCSVVLEGHTGGVFTIQYSPDGKWIATGSADCSASLWDLVSGQCTAKLMHTGTVYSVAFSPDGKFLATASGDQTVGIWDTSRTVGFGHATQHCTALLQGDIGQVYSLAFSPDGKLLITGGANAVKIWDTSTWMMTTAILVQMQMGSTRVPSIAFHPDGKHIATGGLGVARLYDISTSQCTVNIETRGESADGLSDAVAAYAIVALNPDGRQMAVAAENLSNTTRVWDWSTGQCTAELGHARVRCLSFSPDGKQIVTGNADNTARVWDLSSRQCLPVAKVNRQLGSNFVISPDGTKLVSIFLNAIAGRSIVYVWDLMSWECIAMFEGHNVLHPGPTGRYLEAAFSPNGRLICTFASNDSTAWVWDLVSRKCLAMLQGHTRGVSSVTFSWDSSLLVAGSRGNTVKVWELSSMKCLVSVEGQLEPVPEEGLVSSYPHMESPDSGEVYSIAMSPSKQQVALGCHDRARLVDCASRKCIALLQAPNMGPVTSIVFSPDGSSVATASQYEHTARVWEVASGQLTAELKGHRFTSCYSLAFSPDGSKVVTGTGVNSSQVGVMVGPDGAFLTSSSFDSAVVHAARVWDVSSGMWPACTAVLEGHSAQVITVSFSPDGRRIITGSRDQTARVWELADGQMNKTVGNATLFKMQSIKRLQV